MRQTTIVGHLTPEKLKERMLASERREQFQRWQVIYILSIKRLGADETAELVGVAKGTVYQWVHSYNRRGPEALELQGRGGRRNALLLPDEEREVLAGLAEQAQAGAVVIAQRVREHVQERLGRPVSKDYAYDLLHRHGWRKVAPRPKHPKGDEARQEAFKKNFPASWMPPQALLPQETSAP